MYYQKAGERKKAKECIEFVVNSANEHGLLGEQVDNQTMQPNWVIGLRMGPRYVYFGDGSYRYLKELLEMLHIMLTRIRRRSLKK